MYAVSCCVIGCSTICSQILQDPTATSGQYLCRLGPASRTQWCHYRILPQVSDRYVNPTSETVRYLWRFTGYTSKAKCKSLVIKEEMVHFCKAAEGFYMTLRSTSWKHEIVHFYMHSKPKIPLKYVLERAMNSCVGTRGGDKVDNSPVACTLPASRVLLKHWSTEISALCTVNATRGEELQVEEFPPNITSFSVRRYDRYTRYRFSVAARTGIGIGEWHTEESPHYTTESNLTLTPHSNTFSSLLNKYAEVLNGCFDDVYFVCVSQFMLRTRWTSPLRAGSSGSCVPWLSLFSSCS